MNTKVSLSLLFFFALTLQVQGWWDTGHMLVAQIAWKHLSSDASISAATLSSLENAVNSLVSYSPASNTFVTAACWMDDIKTRDLTQFNNWHFINLPICDFPNSTDTDACDGTSVEDVLDGTGNVLWGIYMANRTLRGDDALGFERGFALRNMLHFVGDLHQPLHSVARFCPETPYGDQGGNLFPIFNSSIASNLHSLWDSGVGQLNNSITRPLSPDASSYLSTLADQLITRTANLTQNDTVVNTTLWALEARQLAILYTYNLTFNSTPSEYYLAQAWEVIQDQIGLAGYRLHLILKGIYLCNNSTGNCPEPAKDNGSTKTTSHVWFIVGIACAAALGVSLIINVILIVRNSTRSHYARVQ